MNKEQYRQYLKSPHWRRFRAMVYSLPGTRCRLCGTRKGLNLHHLNYRCLWKEEVHDVVVLCKPCHFKAHDLYLSKEVLTWKAKKSDAPITAFQKVNDMYRRSLKLSDVEKRRPVLEEILSACREARKVPLGGADEVYLQRIETNVQRKLRKPSKRG